MEEPKVIKVTIEYENRIITVTGTEAEKWLNNESANATFAAIHNSNAFDYNPANFKTKYKE